ncbi:non-ribosomal peptide synthetase [Salinispora pacifica]|uniref:non-ribosomal peptide synthetase n=1 Tax=Salinispora pacifica TaxID=351187 RepID=UPI00036507D0|nr:non-ribosomal peptide synthetase [Salinispora pacifica]
MAASPQTLDSVVPTHLRVARQAVLTPNAVALVEGDRVTTYAELDERANRLAHWLIGHGVRPDQPVGVALRRGPGLVVALLAVWKAGAAYVPIDPDHPVRRLVWIIGATGLRLMLTESELAQAVLQADVRPVTLDAVAAELAAQPASSPGLPVDPAQAAYIIHTSGSTGRPKGVVIPHAGLANRIAWAVERHHLGRGDRVLQKTTVTFDAAGWELFAPLVSGGTAVLAPAGAERDAAALLAATARHDVTVLQVVPSVLRLLVEEPGWVDCRSLRLVFVAGEPLHAELVQRLLARVSVEVWNTYGPTECSIDVTAYRVDSAQRTGPVPIGEALPGMHVLVADAAGDPVPTGTVGELYAGGVGVGRGYLNDPGLTAERFVPDPAGGGSRLYRTGDLVRERADGVLEFVGRTDEQVKINGVRVEPGEIEAVLDEHSALRRAVVVARRDPAQGLRLIAYVQLRHHGSLDALRAYLLSRLPPSYVPADFVAVDDFPLTTSGKVDRNALPDPVAAAPTGTPSSTAELLVAKVWRDLLGVEQVGVDDDFFRLGGTSLQLTRLANRLRAASGKKVELRGLLNATTLSAQARLLDTDTFTGRAVRPVPRGGTLPMSYGQQRLWFLDRMSPGSPEWISALVVDVPAGVDPDVVRWAMESLAARHESLRTRFAADEHGDPVQLIDPPGTVELRVVRACRQELRALLKEEAGHGFDLSAGTVWRGLLALLDDGRQVLVLALHHIVVDGWSSAVLTRELNELFDARMQRRAPSLAPLPVQYADYAVWQRDGADAQQEAAELDYWRTALAGLPRVSLPTDHPRPAVRDVAGAISVFSVPPPLTAAIEDLAKRHGVTPFVTLMTAFATLLARYTGEWDIPVGTPLAGRDRPELENVVGFFLNTLVVRCSLDGALTFAEALREVQTVFAGGQAHQHLPFERLVAELEPERDLSRTPLYQIAFDLHDEKLAGAVAGLDDLETLRDAWSIAKTDLSLFMRRLGDGSMYAALEYATALYDGDTIDRLGAHLLRLLHVVTGDPDTRLDAADLTTPGEAETVERAAYGEVVPVLGGVAESIARWVTGTPEVAAIVTDGATISYAELDVRSDRLASHLRALGVGEESVVAVLLERGIDLVVAFLAVWKAGGAYVPLDPAHPADRLTAVVRQSGSKLVVTTVAQRQKLGGNHRYVLTDADADAIAAAHTPVPNAGYDPDRLAYVIFTSGSTGVPKGVQITHGGLANHLRWAADELAGAGTGGAPLFSSVAFDLVVPNIWAPLMTGQRLVILPADRELSRLGERLLAYAPFSFVKATPAHLELFCDQIPPECRAGLAGVFVVAGETLTTRLARRWQGPLVNEYGPTETSVGACTQPVAGATGRETVPIGRPLPNVTMHVLDPNLRRTPVGVLGELYVGGAGVGRGYAGDPAATAAAFVPDPFGPPGSRLYRTGDLVRLLPDGVVLFAGRADHQVKIRGFRIEPGEVDAVLRRHEHVRDALTIAVPAPRGDLMLVTYYVPEGAEADLAAYCAASLPDYLVPARIVAVEAFPLTLNGKVDRRALAAIPAPAVAEPEQLMSPLEERIAAVVGDLLGIAAGRGTHFFRSGGNSILAIRLIAALQQEFGVVLPVRAVFEGPTVAELAMAVEDLVRAEIASLTEDELLAQSASLKEQNR